MNYPSDGYTRNILPEDLVPGVVIREIHPDGSIAPFSDMVILKVDEGGFVTMVRPMVWVATGPYNSGPYMLKAEEFSTGSWRLLEQHCYQTVLLASGKPYTMVMV